MPEVAGEDEARVSYWQMARQGYQELVNAIIRPPRAHYELEHLGPPEFTFSGQHFARIDYDLLNERSMKICCSHWQPLERRAPQLPCVIYMHGNSSARLEAIPQLSVVLSLGCTLLSFDFTGSGLSGGSYVSLGYYEREDLKVVIEHLRQSGSVSYVALWGRSMGAATSLLHGHRDPSIAAMVLDSSFTDLTQLATEMVDKGREAGLVVPNWVVKAALRMIRGSVKHTAKFDIRDLSPIAHASSTFIPALFIAGKHDDFIKPHHSQQIYEQYGGDKNLILVEGDHNSPRPRFLFDSVAIFLQNYLQIPLEWSLNIRRSHVGVPPWYSNNGGIQNNLQYLATLENLMSDPEFFEGGMTAARQQEIQTSLYSMLGDSNAQQRTAPPQNSSASRYAVTHRNEPDDGIRIRAGPSGDDCPVHRTIPEESFDHIDSWTCGLCTLVNLPGEPLCEGCGISYEVATSTPNALQNSLLDGREHTDDLGPLHSQTGSRRPSNSEGAYGRNAK